MISPRREAVSKRMKYNAFVEAEGELASQLSFLAKAVSDNETRPFMWFIHIEPSDKGEGLLGVATDGRRLHLVDQMSNVELFGITPGFWQVLKVGRKVWIARLDDSEMKKLTYPAWRRVMPTGEPGYTTTFSGFSLSRKPEALVKILREFPDATVIQLPYLADLGINFDWKVEWYGPNSALKFTEGDRTAIIIPRQMLEV